MTNNPKRSHDQRKGQFIFNYIREKEPIEVNERLHPSLQANDMLNRQDALISNRLWNMTDVEFDNLLKEFEK